MRGTHSSAWPTATAAAASISPRTSSSVRPRAARYWLARMLAGGEDPLYIARRLVRMAVEDIGLADPNALLQAIAAKDTYDFLGSPEGELALAQATIYLATAPKSNSGYVAFGVAKRAAEGGGSLVPPKHR